MPSEIRDPVFILGDHTGVTEEEEEQLLEAGAKIISVGPISLHSNHCITLIHNELDRAEAERGELPGEADCRVRNKCNLTATISEFVSIQKAIFHFPVSG